jgi:uncharacterized membrane protein YphA (DoxX/SURF4 family)
VFLVLLRVAIGWHFLYEGLEKIDSTRKGGKPFSAEPYLRSATGPLAPYFRNMVPDVDSREMLDADRLKAAWAADVERLAGHYGFDKDQRDAAAARLKESDDFADLWFSDKETREKIAKYQHELGQVEAVEKNLQALSFERERASAKRKELDSERRQLIADLQARGTKLHAAVTDLAKPEQREATGPPVAPWTSLDKVNALTMWGLTAMGVCLILGILGPLAALAGAVFLGQIYLSMPPWPGLPANPMAEGHYFIVNKNLIEMIACLALVFIPTSFWIGFDSLFFGWMFRRRETAETPGRSSTSTVPTTTTTSTGRGAAVDVKPIPLSSPGLTERE